MNPTTVEVLKALGYPLSSVLAFVVLAYISRELFQKLLDSVVARDLEELKRQNAEKLEQLKKDYTLTLEDRKADLGRETERLRASLSVESETYRLAATKRFNAITALWESSESLFRSTDFSSADSIRVSLQSVNNAIDSLSKASILFSERLEENIRSYLNQVATILTNSEADFEQGKVSAKKIAKLVRWGSDAISGLSEEAGIIGAIGASIIESVSSHLEEHRFKMAVQARQALADALRIELGVSVAEHRPLLAALTTKTEVTA